jgi:hypothetical protein
MARLLLLLFENRVARRMSGPKRQSDKRMETSAQRASQFMGKMGEACSTHGI